MKHELFLCYIWDFTICGTITCLRGDKVKFCRMGESYFNFDLGYFLMDFEGDEGVIFGMMGVGWMMG